MLSFLHIFLLIPQIILFIFAVLTILKPSVHELFVKKYFLVPVFVMLTGLFYLSQNLFEIYIAWYSGSYFEKYAYSGIFIPTQFIFPILIFLSIMMIPVGIPQIYKQRYLFIITAILASAPQLFLLLLSSVSTTSV